MLIAIAILSCAASAVSQQGASGPRRPAVLHPHPFKVERVTPDLNALHVSRSVVIEVRFTHPIAAASLNPRNFRVDGRWSGPHTGAIQLTDGGRRLIFTPSTPFSAGETVYVSLSRAVRSTAGIPLGRAYSWNFWADSVSTNSGFTHVDTLVPGDTPYGAYGGDIDGDGFLDLCIPNENTSDVSVFLNDQAGSFGTATSYGVGFHCSPSEGIDMDFDGDIDLVVANILSHDVSVLLGNGDGTFQPQSRYPSGDQPRGLALIDADGDGDMDAVSANRIANNMSLFLNDGTGTLLPATSFDAGVNGETAVSACDMNNDGLFDLVVAGINNGRVGVLLGDGNGGFALHGTRSVGSNPWMVVTGDLNGDGSNDVGAILAGAGSTAICLNDGTGSLGAPASYTADSFPIALDFGDINGDGHLDLTSSSFSSGTFRLYTNDGTGAFVGAGILPAIQAGSCTVLHDYDGDGDVDITAIDELADLVFIFRHDD